MLREGLEFYGRWSSDRELNSSPCVLFKEGQWREGNWTEIQVGDFVRVEDG